MPTLKFSISAIAGILEITAVIATAVGAVAGFLFVIASKPLRNAEAAKSLAMQREISHLTNKNLELEASLEPRRLTEQQVQGLRQISSQGRSVEIQSYGLDVESLVLATQILQALNQSGFRVVDNRSTLQPSGQISFGVAVQGADSILVNSLRAIFGEQPQNINPMFSSRSAMQTSVMFGSRHSRVPAQAVITVGVKPLRP